MSTTVQPKKGPANEPKDLGKEDVILTGGEQELGESSVYGSVCFSTDGSWREVWGGVMLLCMCESIPALQVIVRQHHRVHTEWQRPFTGVHFIS